MNYTFRSKIHPIFLMTLVYQSLRLTTMRNPNEF